MDLTLSETSMTLSEKATSSSNNNLLTSPYADLDSDTSVEDDLLQEMIELEKAINLLRERVLDLKSKQAKSCAEEASCIADLSKKTKILKDLHRSYMTTRNRLSQKSRKERKELDLALLPRINYIGQEIDSISCLFARPSP